MNLSEEDQIDISVALGDAPVEILEADPDGDYDKEFVSDIAEACRRWAERHGYAPAKKAKSSLKIKNRRTE